MKLTVTHSKVRGFYLMELQSLTKLGCYMLRSPFKTILRDGGLEFLQEEPTITLQFGGEQSMAATIKSAEPQKPRRPPATTPEARENQMIAMAVDLAERQIADGTASAQVITHFLKLGTTRERLEQKKLELESDLLRVRAESLEANKGAEELYSKALDAMRTYTGQAPDEEYEN